MSHETFSCSHLLGATSHGWTGCGPDGVACNGTDSAHASLTARSGPTVRGATVTAQNFQPEGSTWRVARSDRFKYGPEGIVVCTPDDLRRQAPPSR